MFEYEMKTERGVDSPGTIKAMHEFALFVDKSWGTIAECIKAAKMAGYKMKWDGYYREIATFSRADAALSNFSLMFRRSSGYYSSIAGDTVYIRYSGESHQVGLPKYAMVIASLENRNDERIEKNDRDNAAEVKAKALAPRIKAWIMAGYHLGEDAYLDHRARYYGEKPKPSSWFSMDYREACRNIAVDVVTPEMSVEFRFDLDGKITHQEVNYFRPKEVL